MHVSIFTEPPSRPPVTRVICHTEVCFYTRLALRFQEPFFFSFSVNGTIFRRLPSEFPPLGQMASIHAAFKLPFDSFFQIIRFRQGNLSRRDEQAKCFCFFFVSLYCVVPFRNIIQLRLKPPKSADVSLWGNTSPQEMWSKANSRTHTHQSSVIIPLIHFYPLCRDSS